jgi:hypothetical protein
MCMNVNCYFVVVPAVSVETRIMCMYVCTLYFSISARRRGCPLIEALRYKPEGRGIDSVYVIVIFH